MRIISNITFITDLMCLSDVSKTTIIVLSMILAIIIGGVGALVYSYAQISVSLDNVEFHSIDWTNFTFSDILRLGGNLLSGNALGFMLDLVDGVNLNLIFGLSNGGFLPVYIPDITYDLIVNGISVGQGISTIDMTINPGQTKQITAFQNFQKSSLVPAIGVIAADGGVMDIKVKGTAHFRLLGLEIPIPFESSKQISIVDEVKKKISEIKEQNKKQGTRISLSVSESAVYQGDMVSINGRLTTADGRALTDVVVNIKDEDIGSGDDDIQRLRTDSRGNFGFNWNARIMDPFDGTVEIHAVFEGNQDFESARSVQRNVYVEEYVEQGYAPRETQSQPRSTFSQTSLSIYIPYYTINSGEILPISGILVDSQGYSLQNGIIYIKDEDTGSGDDDIVAIYTDENGEFYYPWIARTMDPFDDVVEIYAVFEGTQDFGSSRSIQIDILVR